MSDLGEIITNATNAQIYARDGDRCVRCGKRPESVQHRVHGNRKDRRPSNLLSVCGDGTRGCHGWMEAHRRDSREVWGWEVTKYRRQDTTRVTVWYEYGPEGRGWYRLADDLTLNLVERA